MKNLFTAMLAITCLALFSCGNNNSKNNSAASSSSSGNTVTTSGSGDDTYIEMTNNTSGKQMQIQGLTKIFLAANGKVRHEMALTINGKPSSVIKAIGDINTPYESTEIDDSAKTYTVNHTDTSDFKDASNKKFTVNKIGNETIAGFNCVHAQIIANTSYGNPAAASIFNSVDTTDLWMSPDVPMPDGAKKYMNIVTQKMGQTLGNNDVAKQLADMGCVGFPVKFQLHGKDVSSVSVITTIKKDNFSSSLFEIPAGYKKTE